MPLLSTASALLKKNIYGNNGLTLEVAGRRKYQVS